MARPRKIMEDTKEIIQMEVGEVKKETKKEEKEYISCLRNEIIKVRFIKKPDGLIKDPNHVSYGGLIENATRKFCVPILRNGNLTQVLTDSEKDYLEQVMGMEENSLSIYNKKDNYWKNRYVELGKEDTILNLADPIDYIKYKILLCNRSPKKICISEQEYKRNPIPTYEFIITTDKDSITNSSAELKGKAQAYMLYSKISNDYEKLSYILSKVSGKFIKSIHKETIEAHINTAIVFQTDKFIKECENKYLDTELLLNKAVEKGIVEKYRNEYTLKEGKIALYDTSGTPSLLSTCKFLNAPKNQEYFNMIYAYVNN